MIKRIGKEEAERVLDYLNQEGSLNTTLLAHIENYGFEKDFQEVWLQLDDRYKILALIMRHFNHLYLYSSKCICNFEELGSFVSCTGIDIVSGKKDLLSNISPYLKGMVLEPSYHMVFQNICRIEPFNGVERAKLEDCKELASLIYSIPEFARFYNSCDEIERGIRRRMEMGSCRCFVLKLNGVIASQAYTTIESAKYATIGGVVTRPEYRKRGFASHVVSCITMDIIKDNKVPNLFYNNREAGRIYENLGFEKAGDYAMFLSNNYVNKQV